MKTNRLWLPIVAAALLSCCVVPGSIQPERLDSTPETTGLLVVDVDMTHRGSLTLGFEQSIGVNEGTVRLAHTAEAIDQKSLKGGLVLFQLPPGTYELVSVRMPLVQGGFRHLAEPFLVQEVGPIAIAAGRITYVGKLTTTSHSKMGQQGFTYSHSWDRDPAREAEALTIIQQQYKESPWIPILVKRIDLIRQGQS